ncbi:sll0419 [Synechocystis sp. PCC 6803]|uniref:Sll0419 protein n=1 Tax=Synechocystis sp. (strain ATCC 27184 / PCC 6803 / Kazusa) TaxID=1111708 RepID=P74387_SYNY3|nr:MULTISPECIES: DUF6790 family protein [unclassified Synechocystis]BAM54791.1 hypothetical protein BEST7613_5860 [Synechocystis sp. PCC 6803] [Bacillus subtilis BEST7613]AGF52173.1 hypothetical protein MYO_119310 [Synechocystis sp. PCC 6803]ALJ68126.1 hypothetical protein AOY38_09940 [Synechocystis sp. PCC 6803]AVP89965.1 hypothetical protein C7I86_09980 [Synechocystis sp. IPPAS B-1465]MBD2617783.1 hypothetical protein [Synechocystis sp. FACHB-898]
MYFLLVTLVILVFPLLSIALEWTTSGNSQALVDVLARWFVFWGVGVRLFLAGVVQITKPSFTAEKILGVQSQDSLILVKELGIGNLAIASVALGSIFVNAWVLGAALAGGIFYLLAGINHILQPERNAKENYAMATDLFLGLLLGGILFFAWQP